MGTSPLQCRGKRIRMICRPQPSVKDAATICVHRFDATPLPHPSVPNQFVEHASSAHPSAQGHKQPWP